MSSPDPRIDSLELVHEDQRRSIYEVTVTTEGSEPTVQRVTMIYIHIAATLGNHYHDGQEQFTLTQGRARLYTQAVENGEAAGAVQETLLQAPALITIPRGVAHTFVFSEPGVLIALTNCTHEDLGTHKWELA